MAKFYHRPSGHTEGRKVFLATPTYGPVEPGFAYALAESTAALTRAGIGYEIAIYVGDCHVDDARNRVVRQFLMGDCTDLVFIDSDLHWEAGSLLQLLAHDRDVVGATYPLKQNVETYPVRYLDNDPKNAILDKDGLIEAEGVPTGFLRIKRHVLEKMAESAQRYWGSSDAGQPPTPLLFERVLLDGARWGGDYNFCRKWRAMGGKVYVMPECLMDHSGTNVWHGSLGFSLRANGDAIGECLRAIRDRQEDGFILDRLINEWNNPFASDGCFLAASVMLARSAKTILECGSGITTLAMLAANPDARVTCMESSPEWAEKVIRAAKHYKLDDRLTVINAPIVDGWYDAKEAGEAYDLAVADGPSRTVCGREPSGSLNAKVILLDDTYDQGVKQALATLKSRGYGNTHLTTRFAVSYRK